MKSDAVTSMRNALAQDRPVYGLWVTLESPSITEMAVALGLDWVVIDAEHGHLDWGDLVAHVRATVRSRTVCLIRIAALDAGLIKRALDIGADGVVVPWMESASQVAAALHAASYPPAGRRGIGAERATAWGRCIAEHVRESVAAFVVPIVESVQGGACAAEMAAVPGVDLFFIGPADWSATAGFAGQWAGPEVSAQIASACRAIKAAGKQVGVLASSEDDLRRRRQEGFRMLGLGIDGALLLRSLDAMLCAGGRLHTLTTALTPHRLGTPANPLLQIPACLQPERPARVVLAEQAQRVDLDDGVVVRSFVGRPCAARGVTAAIVTFAPGGTLVRHAHPQPETIVVLSGSIQTEIDGRRLRLHAGQSMSIPAGRHHQTGNASRDREAIIHVCMPSDAITRTVVAAAPSVIEVDGEAVVERPAQGGAAMIEHAGVSRPEGGLRCRSHWLPSGTSLQARVQSVDSALMVITGSVRVRTAAATWRVEALAGIHLPRGVAYEILAVDDAHLIETCADGEPLDALVDESLLHPQQQLQPPPALPQLQPLHATGATS